MLIPDPFVAAGDDAALELALLRSLVDAVPLPPPSLPGWQSLAAIEYALAVREVGAALGAAAAEFAAAGATS